MWPIRPHCRRAGRSTRGRSWPGARDLPRSSWPRSPCPASCSPLTWSPCHGQELVPDALELGSALPRAVPFDAVIAVLAQVVPKSLLLVALASVMPTGGAGPGDHDCVLRHRRHRRHLDPGHGVDRRGTSRSTTVPTSRPPRSSGWRCSRSTTRSRPQHRTRSMCRSTQETITDLCRRTPATPPVSSRR